MEIKILAFGQIADIAGAGSWKEPDIDNTDNLKKKLESRFPLLHDLNYVIAVDKTIIQQNTQLQDQATVALLPPYSGG